MERREFIRNTSLAGAALTIKPISHDLLMAVESEREGSMDLARYKPSWISEGFIDGGATHEPWIFQVRRNGSNFNQWQKDDYEYHLSEEYIKLLSEAGVTVYHVSCYKGFGFEAEKSNMDKVAKAATIAHKYGMKVDTYVQWKTMCYETFFAEVPEAQTDIWYQIDVNGKPIMLTYGFQQSFRYAPCFNHEGYVSYFKEKIIRYIVEVVKTDFIHFDNFDFNPPADADHNPATIIAFRKYITEKYTPSECIVRFGFEDMSFILPPMWNDQNQARNIVAINDPVIQEWIDFRCKTMVERLAECARFARQISKEVVIEVNPHGLVGTNRAWEAGIDHSDLMQYTNVIWTEDNNNPRWENGVAIGKFRHYKLGRTTNNFILTYNRTPNDFAENLALNRTIGYVGMGVPRGTTKKYTDFWLKNKELFTNMTGNERVAVLRSYPSMAYNNKETQKAVNMAEQALQQRQIPFDIIFDQQMGDLKKYFVLVLANQESLTEANVGRLKNFVKRGGGLVVTSNTGMYDGWRRLRKDSLVGEMLLELDDQGKRELLRDRIKQNTFFKYGKGKVVYITALYPPEGEPKLGFASKWNIPKNINEFEAAVNSASSKELPLQVIAPEWVGVSHDIQNHREVVHLFNYDRDHEVKGVIVKYNGKVNSAWGVSPDRNGKVDIEVTEKDGLTEIVISELKVYNIIILEKE